MKNYRQFKLTQLYKKVSYNDSSDHILKCKIATLTIIEVAFFKDFFFTPCNENTFSLKIAKIQTSVRVLLKDFVRE